MEFTAEMIAGLLGGAVEGDKTAAVHTVSSIEGGKRGSLTYLTNPKYEQFIYTTEASIVLVDEAFRPSRPVAATLVRIPDVGGAIVKLLEMYNAAKPRKTGIGKMCSISDKATVGKDCYVGDFAVIEAGAEIGDGAQIYPQAYIGDGVKIGAGTVVYAGAKIYEGCRIGARCIIHAGAVIGADGFGFMPKPDGSFDKIPQLGNVVIGANTCIDRAKTDSTIIRRGVKLDNLIQVGHNVEIGENTVSSAQMGIAGTSKIGRNCFLAGQVGIADHVTVGDRVKIGSKTGLDKDVPDGEIRFGYPALPGMQYHRSFAVFKNLPDLAKRVAELEKSAKKE